MFCEVTIAHVFIACCCIRAAVDAQLHPASWLLFPSLKELKQNAGLRGG